MSDDDHTRLIRLEERLIELMRKVDDGQRSTSDDMKALNKTVSDLTLSMAIPIAFVGNAKWVVGGLFLIIATAVISAFGNLVHTVQVQQVGNPPSITQGAAK